jgi:hypothetical protein
MARKRNWKDKRAWIESDAKKMAQAYADKKPFLTRLLCMISKRARAKWAKKRVARYTKALKFYLNRASHSCYKKTPEDLRQERVIHNHVQRLREKEIREGKRYPVRMKPATAGVPTAASGKR